MKLKAYGNIYKVRVKVSSYVTNDALAIGLECWEEEYNYWAPFCVLTKNMGAAIPTTPEKNLCAIDTNNCPFVEDFIKEYELGKPAGFSVSSGFCNYPVYQMNIDRLKELQKQGEAEE